MIPVLIRAPDAGSPHASACAELTLRGFEGDFSPDDRVNPGRIATPAGARLMTVDGVPTRGRADRTIPARVRAGFDEALHCDGNDTCFTYDPDGAMCPFRKAARERRHSPEGHAGLMREWLRRGSEAGAAPAGTLRRQPAGWLGEVARTLRAGRGRDPDDFSHADKEAMDGCLTCKSCTGSCPIKVDVPTFRAKFLGAYHARYPRPWKDTVVAALERMLPLAARMPGLANAALSHAAVRRALARAGLLEIPAPSRFDLAGALAGLGVARATPEALARLDPATRAKSVVVQDASTHHLETSLVADLCALLVELGFRPWLVPNRPNGKPLHVHGFLARLARTAGANAAMLRALEAEGVPLIGLDPSMTLTHRAKYPQALGEGAAPRVQLMQEWLAGVVDRLPHGMSPFDTVPRDAFARDTHARAARPSGPVRRLLRHCTGRTNAPGAVRDWKAAFARFGLMAGTYGREARHRATAETIYVQGWARHVAGTPADALLADGYSCRSQAKFIDGVRLRHPVQALLDHLRTRGAAGAGFHPARATAPR